MASRTRARSNLGKYREKGTSGASQMALEKKKTRNTQDEKKLTILGG